MVSMLKFIGSMSCGVVLCLSVPYSAQAINNFAEELKELKKEHYADGQASLAENEEAAKGLQTIYGEVLQIKQDKYLVRKYDGEVIRLRLDNNTHINGTFRQGDRIVAKVNDEKHVLLIHSVQ